MPLAPLTKLRLYLQSVSYLRRDQLAYLMFRRMMRAHSRPHRALDRIRQRDNRTVDFATVTSSRELDRLALGDAEEIPPEKIDWQTAQIWRPLRYQVHYFDFLNDRAYSDEWKGEALEDWILGNPAAVGDGWIPYAVSLRIVNWIKFFTHVGSPIAELRLESLYAQALWLERNLERHILANHYLKNAKALVFAGLFFDGTDARRWLRTGLAIFCSEAKEQFLLDGGHFERSPMYHALAVEDLLDTINYLEAAAVTSEPATLTFLRNCARAALDFYAAILLPDGQIPLFNDSAFNVGLQPDELFAYAHSTLGYTRTTQGEGMTVHALSSSGYYVIRSAADMLVLDCGAPGPRYQPGHAHCDCLSYELAIAGRRIAVDTGVFNYENNAARHYARGTSAHNTVQVDSAEQSEMWDVFRVGRRANPLGANLSTTGAGTAVFTGAHDGFRGLAPGIIHRRTVGLAGRVWSFEDCVEGEGAHAIQSRVHIEASLAAHVDCQTVRITSSEDGAIAELRAQGPLAIRTESAPYYPSFGRYKEGTVIVMEWQGRLPITLSYTIAPASQ